MDLRESMVTEMIQRDDRSKWLSYSNHNIKCFTEDDIGRITSNYETIIGKGGFGEVYKGVLQNGRIVAVKKFMCNVEEIFAKELKVHCEINHKNVVRLIGYCAEENALMIVSEYISKGNLSDVLHHECTPITLDTRLRIAMECSEALCYMHSQMYTQVIHGDIKPANILLDDNFNAKISDFGVSRLVNTDSALFTEHVIGSIGYMDPLFARSGRLTSKSDVYSFGIVLLELITKKKATVRNGETGIAECFTQALATGKRRVSELFDVEISSQNNVKVLEGVAKLAEKCLRMEMGRRPEMRYVAERLRALRKTQVQGKQTIFPWGWRNKPEAQNNWQSSSSVMPQSLPSNLCRPFSLREMKSATRNFDGSHLIGHGESGRVYYGMIDGGATKVAIKPGGGEQDVNKFETEIVMMAKLRHHHLVSLVGYCKEQNQSILIYDYMARGTLSENLYSYKTEEPPLTWRQRLDVCIGAARALQYLHDCSIIHTDVSTTNIVLDERLVGKFSSIVSLLQDATDVTTQVVGRFGFLDAESLRTGQLTEKSNVYSFGVVLFEVLCARAVYDTYLPRGQANLVECALSCQKMGILDLIVDPYLEGKIAPQCFNKFVEIAEKCVSDRGIDRPTMQEVLENLKLCLAEQSGSLDDETTDDDDDSNGPSRRDRRLNLERYLSEDDDSSHRTSNLCRHFSLNEMKSATRNFDESHLVGVGASREVYCGVIDGGATRVAIKRDKVVQDLSKFQTEIMMMAKLRHHHLVSLVGYCKEENDRILIYNYMAHGTLRGNLYANNTKELPLTWRQRLDVCIGAAGALHYLHECSIIHNDVSTASILLAWRLVGKVSIKVSLLQDGKHATTLPMERHAFLDAESLLTEQLTEKSNVYSFGVVLFEVLCARAVYDPYLPRGQANLVECALSCQKTGILDLIVDPYIEGKIAPRCLKKFVEIAKKCVNDRGIDRPTMQEVLENLELCLAEQSGSLGDETPDDDEDTNGPSRREHRLNLERYLSEDDDSSHCISTLCCHFSLNELKSATRNFDESHLVGVGASRAVYCGVIDGGATRVAIKRDKVMQDSSKFQTEIMMMAKLRHHHLISLVGYCKEKNESILIYDYMAHGTLRGNLYANNTKEPPLTWGQLLDVCIGAARALHYLHECSIIHNDVSMASILLDWRLAGKVSIKLSLLQDAMDVTRPMERHAFLDPEFFRTWQLTEKSNVYSFGVVLFEVLCARAAFEPNLPERQAHLVECALDCQKKGILGLIVDPCLEGKMRRGASRGLSQLLGNVLAIMLSIALQCKKCLRTWRCALQSKVEALVMEGMFGSNSKLALALAAWSIWRERNRRGL